jgi:hypothetical protein
MESEIPTEQRPLCVTVEAISPAEVPRVMLSCLKNARYRVRPMWLLYKLWTNEQAAWLGLGIDPPLLPLAIDGG